MAAIAVSGTASGRREPTRDLERKAAAATMMAKSSRNTFPAGGTAPPPMAGRRALGPVPYRNGAIATKVSSIAKAQRSNLSEVRGEKASLTNVRKR